MNISLVFFFELCSFALGSLVWFVCVLKYDQVEDVRVDGNIVLAESCLVVIEQDLKFCCKC